MAQPKQQTIFRVIKDRENPYVMLDKRIVENPELTWGAKGLLSYLLSRPNNWSINITDLVNRSPDKEFCVRGLVKELRLAGYIHMSRPKDERGLLGATLYEVFESPEDNPHRGNPHVDYPYVGNLPLNNIKVNNTDINKKDISATPDHPEPGDQEPAKEKPNLLCSSSPIQEKLFNALTDERRAKFGKGAKPITKFPTLACKEKFIKSETRLNQAQMEHAIKRAMEVGATSVTRAVDYISGFDPSYNFKQKSPAVAPAVKLTPEQAEDEFWRLNAHLLAQKPA